MDGVSGPETRDDGRGELLAKRVHLSAQGFATRLLIAGAGTPVLLLHGNPDCADEWRGVARELGGFGRCIAPDLPGFGESGEPPASFDFSRAAHESFLDAVLEAERVTEPLILVVHDIGGVFGVLWAAKHLSRVAGVVITNTVVFENFPWFPIARMWARRDPLGRARAKASMWLLGQAKGALFRRLFGRISPELTPAELARINQQFALDAKSKRSTLRLFPQMVAPEYFQGADAALRGLIARVPVRVVWGLHDPYIPDCYAERFAGAEVQKLANAGHWVPIAHAAEVAAAIRSLMPS